MPERLYSSPGQPDGAVTCNLVAFHPADGEQLYFSWSDWTTRGPGISRNGVTSPFMRAAWSTVDPWGTTDDAEEMRTWSSYIDEDCLTVEELLSLPPEALARLTGQACKDLGVEHLFHPGQALSKDPPSDSLRATYRRRSLEGRRVNAVHTARFRERHPGKSLVGQVGAGDTTMNHWHVGFVRDAGGRSTFLHLEDEPIHHREYPCLVSWRGSADGRVSFEEAVRFNPGTSPRVSIGNNPKDRTSDIDFAVSGKPLLSLSGAPIPLNQVTHFFRDLRHLFSLPKLTPPKRADPVVMFGREITGDLWLGEKQLLDDVNLQRAASMGPVLLDRLYGGLSVTEPYLRRVLDGSGYKERQSGDPVEWETGSYRIDSKGHGFEIFFREARYPWNILAVGSYRDGGRAKQPAILSFVCGGQSGRTHFTLREAVEELRFRADERSIDLTGAVLMDEGGDVFQKVAYGTDELQATPLDPLPLNGLLACQRRLVRCCFLFAKDESTRPAQVR